MSVYGSQIKVKEAPLPITILVDSREQKPLWNNNSCKRLCLIVGDYTTKKLNSSFIIERKSPQDLYGTITRGNVRFKRELRRAIERNINLVVYVETTRENFINKKFTGGNRLKYPSTGLERILNALTTNYQLQFVWCSSRADMKDKVIKRLLKEEKNL